MHGFVLSESNKCAKCKRPEVDHTEHATCEACDYVGKCELCPTAANSNVIMLLCPSCIRKEVQTRTSPNEVNKVIEDSKRQDTSIQLRSDIFNAQTTSIIELKQAIDSDSTIENKHFTLASVLTDRLNHFKKVIFELNQEMVDRSNEQRAIQVYLNDLSNKLRVEEREKIKLADISYQPNPIKISKPRASGPSKKFDKTEIRKYALEVGVPESVLQMVCVAKNLTPEQAKDSLKKAMGL